MKILVIITNGLKRDGITTSELELFKIMDKADMQIDIASVTLPNESIAMDFRRIGCNVIDLPNRNKNTFKYISALMTILRKEKYDIIHVHGSSSIMALELLTAKISGTKVRIAHSRNTQCKHENINRFFRPIFHLSYNTALACGEAAGKWLFGNRPFTIMYNGIDLKKFKFSNVIRNTLRKQYNLASEKAIGFVGTLNEQKNPEYLIKIFYEIYKEDKNTHFFIIGNGKMRESLENKVNTLGIAEVTTFTGSITNVNEFLQAMDVMLLPSKWEGLPNVVIEWQAAGLPCVISDCITRECAVTDLVKFESIDKSPDVWARDVLQLNMGDREANSKIYLKQLKDSGFDLNNTSEKMRDLYFKCFNEMKGNCE